ncbi:hypothetical protein CR513_56187, partial [Mucuna pruriens]
MRKRFVPSSYVRDLYNKLQRLYEGSKSVEEESEEATMVRLFHWLNREIQDMVELHNYSTLRELVRHAIKVEMQLRRSTFRRSTASSSRWRKRRDKEKKKVRSNMSPKKVTKPF